MTELYSVPNNKYWLFPSIFLTDPKYSSETTTAIPNSQTVKYSNKSRVLLPAEFIRVPNQQYGYLKKIDGEKWCRNEGLSSDTCRDSNKYFYVKESSNNSTILLSLDIKSVDTTRPDLNKDALFYLTYDGHLYNVGKNKYITSPIIDSNNNVVFQFLDRKTIDESKKWNITEYETLIRGEKIVYEPQLNNSISLWNKGILSTVTYTSPQIDGSFNTTNIRNINLANSFPFYSNSQLESIDKAWFSYVRTSPNIDYTQIYANIEKCVLGLIKRPVTKLIDGDFCKILHENTGNFQSEGGFNIDLSEFPLGAWAPWTRDSAETQAVKNFCSQHDSIKNTPFFESNSSYNGCKNWYLGFDVWTDQNISDKQTKISQRQELIKALYCEKYPNSDKCADYCIKFTKNTEYKTNCDAKFRDYCKSSNLEDPVCQKYCSKKEATSCSTSISEYCKLLKDSGINIFDNSNNNINNTNISPERKRTLKKLCGCFMPEDFYNTYFRSLSQVLNSVGVGSVVTRSKTCDFFPCSNSDSIKPDDIRNGTRTDRCTTKVECIQNSNINITGTIITDSSLNISQLQKCFLNIGLNSTPSEKKTYCKGANLEDPICIEYCNTTNCDAEINAYCNSVNRENSDNIFNSNVSESTKNFCACFMNDAFYNSIKGEITRNYDFKSNAPNYCFFNLCLNSTNKRFSEKSNPAICPDQKICFNYTSVNKNGIPTNITLNSSSICTNIRNKNPLSNEPLNETQTTPLNESTSPSTTTNQTNETSWYKDPLNIVLIIGAILLVIIIVVL